MRKATVGALAAAAVVFAAPSTATVTIQPNPGTIAVDAQTVHIAGINAQSAAGPEDDFWGPGISGLSWGDRQTGSGSAVSSFRGPVASSWPFIGAAPAWSGAGLASVDLAAGELKAYAMAARGVGGGRLADRFVEDAGVARSLKAKLDAAEAARSDGARDGQLGAFGLQVEALAGKKLSAADAAVLVRLAGALAG